MHDGFTERLGRLIGAGRAPAVAGLDPRPDTFPAGLAPGAPPAERIVAFYREVLPVLEAHVCAVKPNIAFFERYGADGYRAYENTCRLCRAAGLLVIGDVKRGDIGSTSSACAEEHFRHADAVTLHPYLGTDSIEPFLELCRRGGRGVFVLVRTSNDSAHEFQELRTERGTLSEVVADAVDRWGEGLVDSFGYSAVGAVVGATYADQLAAYRRRMPRAWLLLPGVGAQGGRVADLAPAFDARGLGALISQSRGILQCFEPGAADWLDRVERAVRSFVHELREVSQPTP